MPDDASIQNDLRCFDNARFGVMQMDLEGLLEYANKWSLRLLGLESYVGVSMLSLLADEASSQTVEREVESRRLGHSGEYILKLKTRRGQGKDVRVHVLGTPVVGRDGTVRSTIGLFFNLEFDDVIAELRGLGEAATDARTLFGRLTEALARVFAFDALVISLFEEDGRYSRVFFRSYSEQPDAAPEAMTWERPWIRLTEAQRNWMLTTSAKQRIIGDFPAFLEDPLWAPLRAEPATVHFVELGIKSIVGLLVREGGNVVASLSLMSKQRDFYGLSDVLELDSLPLDKCILAVLHNIRRHEMEFHFGLLQQLLALPTVRDMAVHLVKAIGTEYKLSHVSLLRVDWSLKRIQLQAQWVQDGGQALPHNYEQPVEKGVVGAVARSGEALYIPNVAREKQRYVPGALDPGARTGSEFCWPVFYGEGDKRVAWIFNIEDLHEDSLSPREQRTLAQLAIEVGGLLQRMNDLAFLKATFASTSDPVVVIDNNGSIKKINPAAGEIFEAPPPGHLVGNLASYIDDKDAAALFLSNSAPETELVLRVGESRIPVLISSCPLPEGLVGRVLLIKDMRPVRRAEELRYLGQVSQEVSIQAQTPLALVATWVQRLNRSLSARREHDDLLDLTVRIGAQLKRIQGVLSRLALYDQYGAFSAGRRIPISLQSEVEGLLARLTPADLERIQYTSNGNMDITGDPIHYAFVLETCIAFLLRHLPDGELLTIRLAHDASSGWVECRGYDATERDITPDVRQGFTTQLSDKLGLAESALRAIMSGFDGSFERRCEKDGLTILTVRAPLARTARAAVLESP